MHLGKTLSTNKPLSIAVAITLLLCVGVFVLFVFQKKTYITADLFITGGEWWWTTASPPYWLGNPLARGAAEYDVRGQKVVDVLEVQKFEEPNRLIMLVKARLLVSKNNLTKKYRFKQNPLEIGTTISISPGNIQLYSNVVGIEGVQDLADQETTTVVVRWFNVFPWQADAIHVGDTAKDGSGVEVAKVLTKEVSIAEKTVVTENNQIMYGVPGKQTGQLILLRSDPLRRDVTMTLELKVRSVNGQSYFGFLQNIKIGEPLYISLPSIFINPIIVSLTSTMPTLY